MPADVAETPMVMCLHRPISSRASRRALFENHRAWRIVARTVDPDTLKPMNLPIIILAALSAGLLFSACEKQPPKSEAPAPELKPVANAAATPAVAEVPVKVDADKLLQSFGSAGPEEQSRVGKAAQAIRAENYSSALEILEHLLAQGHLTPEQKELVTGLVSQLQKSKQDKR